MDWLDLLLLAAFVLFPLLQQLLERGRRSSTPPSEPMDTDSQTGPSPIEGERTRQVGLPAEWGGWTPERIEDLDDEERSVEDEEAAEPISPYAATPRPDIPMSTADTVVSLEQLHVDRVAERARFHQQDSSAQLAARAAPVPRLVAMLRGRRRLREAIVVSEVLGPPKSLR